MFLLIFCVAILLLKLWPLIFPSGETAKVLSIITILLALLFMLFGFGILHWTPVVPNN